MDDTQLGAVTWHSSEEDGPPDVGMTLGLGDGQALWIGEITNRAYDEAGEAAKALGSSGGWWLSLYPGFRPIAKFVDAEEAREFFDRLFAALQKAKALS